MKSGSMSSSIAYATRFVEAVAPGLVPRDMLGWWIRAFAGRFETESAMAVPTPGRDGEEDA